MTPDDFIAQWRGNTLKERSASQTHFNQLCALLGVVDPVTADRAGEWFTFERGATKSDGGDGWADVWRKDCFAWEYKGPHKDLGAAYDQLLRYRGKLDNPPLLIVSDMATFRVHTNWTNTVEAVETFTLDDLRDAAKRDRLKAAFTDPEAFKPTTTRADLTEETAREFAALAERLRARGHDASAVAHFVNRLVFCMFAQSTKLLPDGTFGKMLAASKRAPHRFVDYAGKLFAAMRTGGELDYEPIDWFNGGLFDAAEPLPLIAADIADLLTAAKRDWSQIDPAILGTLFERGLDPAKRSQLGAHYTDRAKIMLIVAPVIIDPLTAEWEATHAAMTALLEPARAAVRERIAAAAGHSELADEVRALSTVLTGRPQLELFADLQQQKRVRALDDVRAAMRAARDALVAVRDQAAALHSGFIERLTAFRVLDPACGSGNFLYVALGALKDIEHRANLDAEALGLPRGFTRVGPENLLGIELNPFAAELARVSVWIGEIQWMRKNGYVAATNPILRPLDTIECRDAVLNADGTRAAWPAADVVVGNPPFLGNKKMIGELGEDYTRALRAAWPAVPGGADLVCYWFAAAWDAVAAGRVTRAGLVATNSIRGGANRAVLKPIVDQGRIFAAWSDEGWTVEGAAVRVSVVCFDSSTRVGATLDGTQVAVVHADLTGVLDAIDLTRASLMRENREIAFQGTIKTGPFEIDGDLARGWIALPLNPNGLGNARVLRPWANGMDLTRRPSGCWVIDFGNTMTEHDAALFEAPFGYLRTAIDRENAGRLAAGKPLLRGRETRSLDGWWLHQRPRPEMRRALAGLPRYILSPRVSKHRLFVWTSSATLADSAIIAIARDDDTTFGILHSRFHELWSLRMGTFLGVGNDPRYTPSTTFETFPFPAGLTPDIPAADYAAVPAAQAIAVAAARLNELRENWLNPADLTVRVPEVVAGYPDRILPRDEAAAAVLKGRTLTNLYNARPAWLANAHAALDAAVADAYGWGAEWRAGPAGGAGTAVNAGTGQGLTDDAILARLFALNQERG